MFKFIKFAPILVLLCTGSVFADSCPGGCPTITVPNPGNGTGTATNNTNNNVTGVSNPTAANINQNNNFATNSVYSYGGGISCQDTTLTPYYQQSNLAGAGYTNSSVTSFGVGATIPIGSNHHDCETLAKIVIQQHRNDTTWGNAGQCLNFYKAGMDLTSPSLNGMCLGYNFAPTTPTIIHTPPTVVYQPVEKIKYQVYHEASCINDLNRDADLATLHAYRHQLKTKHPSKDLVDLHDKLSHSCNVTSTQIITALDG